MLQTIQPFFMRSMYSLTTTFLLPKDTTHNKSEMNADEKPWKLLGLVDERSFGKEIDLKWLKEPLVLHLSFPTEPLNESKEVKMKLLPKVIHPHKQHSCLQTELQFRFDSWIVLFILYLTGTARNWSIIRTFVKLHLIEIQDWLQLRHNYLKSQM